jgi:hypothetical protein
MVTLTGAPEWNLHFWSWEKGKVLASVKTTTHSATERPGLGQGTMTTNGKEGPKDTLIGQVVYQWY